MMDGGLIGLLGKVAHYYSPIINSYGSFSICESTRLSIGAGIAPIFRENNMEKFTLSLGASILLLASVQAEAVIVGDKDWLQVSDIPFPGIDRIGYNWTDFDAIFDTATGECDVTDCVVDIPYHEDLDLTGYTWASNSEVNELFMSYTGGVGLNSFNSNNAVQLEDGALFGFFNDFWPTYNDSEGGQSYLRIEGWTRNYSAGELGTYGDVVWASQFYPNELYESPASALLGLDIYQDTVCTSYDCRELRPGGWFYRLVAIPAPSTQLLFLAGLVGLGVARGKMEIIGGGTRSSRPC